MVQLACPGPQAPTTEMPYIAEALLCKCLSRKSRSVWLSLLAFALGQHPDRPTVDSDPHIKGRAASRHTGRSYQEMPNPEEPKLPCGCPPPQP